MHLCSLCLSSVRHRKYSCAVVQFYSCSFIAVQLYNCTAIKLQLYGCTIVQLYSCTVVYPNSISLLVFTQKVQVTVIPLCSEVYRCTVIASYGLIQT